MQTVSHAVFHRLLVIVVLILSASWAIPAAGQTDTQPEQPKGTVVEGPANIRQFAPADEEASNKPQFSIPIDPAAFELRKLFEALGADAALWYQHVQTLANPFFEGRAPGTRGAELAADYVEFWFKQYGLEPALPASLARVTQDPHQQISSPIQVDDSQYFADHKVNSSTWMAGANVEGVNVEQSRSGRVADDARPVLNVSTTETGAWTSYRQHFDFASPNPDVKVRSASAAINGKELEYETEAVVLGNSGNGAITAPVTFVGYAIEEGREEYTSFDENTDLTGRIALMLRYEPLNEDGTSKWAPARFSRASSIAPKMRAVAERGAAGIILVNPPGAVDGKSGLESIKESGRFGRRLDVPVFQFSPEAADQLLKAADPEKRDLMAWRRLADNGEVRTVALKETTTVTLSSDLDVDDRLHTENVAAVLPGKGSLADQWIIIGAHMDHVGHGYTGTMPGNVGKLHPGADDNASGTAGLLLAAKRLSESYRSAGDGASLRSIMFIAFGAEEAGLIGSKHFVEHSPINADSASLMINMDMIGRMRGNNVSVQGTGTAENFKEFLQPHFESSGLKISASEGGRGPSDHTSFYNAGIPILFMFTGLHPEYHQPTDRAYTVNPAGAVKVINLLVSIVMDAADNPEKFKYVLTQAGGAGRVTGARVRLGIQPSYTAELETGVLVEAITEGTSAADGGVLAGDILLSWNGEELTGGQKLFELLSKHEPGDSVRLIVQRGNETVTLDVTLKARATE